jgi:hypothetical protein
LEWDKFQVDLQYTLEVPKPALVKLASNHIFLAFWHDYMVCGAIPLNVQAKLERDEDLTFMI